MMSYHVLAYYRDG